MKHIKVSKNQCDGCRRGLPIENGIHIDKDNKFNKLYMGCCKSDYKTKREIRDEA